jgi:hypothetical protein
MHELIAIIYVICLPLLLRLFDWWAQRRRLVRALRGPWSGDPGADG